MALTNNLVAYYKLDGNSNDSVGSNNGTDTSITYSTGKISNAAFFNATTDKIICGDTPFDFERTQAFSISLWIKINSTSVNRFPITKQEASGNYRGFSLWHTTTNVLNFALVSTGTNKCEIQSPTITDTTNWMHVVVTYDGSSSTNGMAIWVNNSEQSKGVVSNNLTTSILNDVQLEIGNRNAAFNFDGGIDEIGVWSRNINSTEISQLYNGGNGLPYPYGTAYNLTASQGSYSLTGITNSLKKNLRLLASTGAFVLTGIAALFTRGKGISVEVMNFVLTSGQTNFRKTLTLLAAKGAYVLTGIDATFDKTKGFVGEVISYLLNLGNIIIRGNGSWLWRHDTKPTSNWTNSTKPSSSYTNETKPTSNWINDTK